MDMCSWQVLPSAGKVADSLLCLHPCLCCLVVHGLPGHHSVPERTCWDGCGRCGVQFQQVLVALNVTASYVEHNGPVTRLMGDACRWVLMVSL
jgi:hypothetical protein